MSEKPTYKDLAPLDYPLGDDHHTDVPFTTDDDALGHLLGWYLGGLFIDVEDKGNGWFYHTNTSFETWRRVARALRIHGLTIANRPPDLVEIAKWSTTGSDGLPIRVRISVPK